MKFSAMNTREQAKVICRIAPIVSRIGQDDEFNKALSAMAKDSKESENKTVLQKASAMIDALAPMLLDRHYDDALLITGELLGKTADELEGMGLLTIIRGVKGVIDEELIGFFKPSAATDTKA